MKITEAIATLSSESPFDEYGGYGFSYLTDASDVDKYSVGIEVYTDSDHTSITLYTSHDLYTKMVSSAEIKEMLDLLHHAYIKTLEFENKE